VLWVFGGGGGGAGASHHEGMHLSCLAETHLIAQDAPWQGRGWRRRVLGDLPCIQAVLGFDEAVAWSYMVNDLKKCINQLDSAAPSIPKQLGCSSHSQTPQQDSRRVTPTLMSEDDVH